MMHIQVFTISSNLEALKIAQLKKSCIFANYFTIHTVSFIVNNKPKNIAIWTYRLSLH